MTHTLLLELPEQVYETLTKTAKRRSQRPETVAVQWLVTATQSLSDDPFEPFIGAFSSDVPDWADHHDEYIGKGLMAELHDYEEQNRVST